MPTEPTSNQLHRVLRTSARRRRDVGLHAESLEPRLAMATGVFDTLVAGADESRSDVFVVASTARGLKPSQSASVQPIEAAAGSVGAPVSVTVAGQNATAAPNDLPPSASRQRKADFRTAYDYTIRSLPRV